ncbi:signal peptide peptidase SppA [Myxosarcina sp. GI1(2024)]
MRLDRVFALILIVLCLIAALGNWLGDTTQSREVTTEGIKIGARAEVALLEIYGLISDQPTTTPLSVTNTSNSNALIKAIRQARQDGIKAILLHINSPGGTPAASQAIYQELMRTRQETEIKIVASLGDVAASGGYYVASAAHHIMANPATVTGSIGVIVRSQNISPLLDKIGVQTNNIQSGQYKDILSPFDELSESERSLLEGIVTQTYQQFLDAIVASRNISLEELKPLADGRIFTGEQAKQVNLVDSLGNSYDALQKAAELANITREPRVRNYTSPDWRESLGIFLSSSWQQLLSDSQSAQLIRWSRNQLNLME